MQFALLQLPPPKLEVVCGLPLHVYYCSKLLDHFTAPPLWLTYSKLIGISYSGVSVNVCVFSHLLLQLGLSVKLCECNPVSVCPTLCNLAPVPLAQNLL